MHAVRQIPVLGSPVLKNSRHVAKVVPRDVTDHTTFQVGSVLGMHHQWSAAEPEGGMGQQPPQIQQATSQTVSRSN